MHSYCIILYYFDTSILRYSTSVATLRSTFVTPITEGPGHSFLVITCCITLCSLLRSKPPTRSLGSVPPSFPVIHFTRPSRLGNGMRRAHASPHLCLAQEQQASQLLFFNSRRCAKGIFTMKENNRAQLEALETIARPPQPKAK